MPEPEDRHRARWEQRIPNLPPRGILGGGSSLGRSGCPPSSVAPPLAVVDACTGHCQEACRLWAVFVRDVGPERVALTPSG